MQNCLASKGSNIYLIGGISCENVVFMTITGGAFKSQNANEWLQELFIKWESQGNVSKLFVVCGNAPCHSPLKVVANVPLLNCGLYSPALNPLETVWSSIKSSVKENLTTPVVEVLNVGE